MPERKAVRVVPNAAAECVANLDDVGLNEFDLSSLIVLICEICGCFPKRNLAQPGEKKPA